MQHKIENVLDDYQKDYSIKQIKELVEEWNSAKSYLISILSKHPNWNEDLKCIILDCKESRGNDRRFYHFDMLKTYISNEMSLSDETLKILREFYISNLDQFLDSDIITCINNISTSFGFKKGQKTSRAINKIYNILGADKLPEYNKLFAQFADSVNPLIIDRTAILSVNPIDYLLMSNGTGWKSCHNLLDGCYMAGTLSYMGDETSMIFFTIENDEGDIQLTQKITRNVFCYSDGKLLQSRLYPDNNETSKQNYRQIVQKIFADCLQLPNIWRLEKDFNIVMENTETYEDSHHYADYSYNDYNPNISFIKDFEINDDKIIVGSSSYCLECGLKLSDSGSLSCCSNYHYCEDCGCRLTEDDIIWVNDTGYCSGCVSYCERCGEYTRDNLNEVNGRYDYVCDSCLSEYYEKCEDCGCYVPYDDTTYIESEDMRVCDDCFKDNYFRCDECYEYFSNSEKNEHDGNCYCQTCFEENYFYCDHCEKYHSVDEQNIHNGDVYCDDCYKELEENTKEELEEKTEIEKEVC